jgi:hypothetical protein
MNYKKWRCTLEKTGWNDSIVIMIEGWILSENMVKMILSDICKKASLKYVKIEEIKTGEQNGKERAETLD